ncbi:hypothetical protein K502DRAFT_294715 [Neoconidiobolus thromboides FSU 785]|nr:hypothetical protein K502DRAFT_294715 [Neoconidiobolus thromboides FSU 785]
MPKPKQTTKRLRRKYDEIVRLYKCNYGTCSKSYGTLNHLNCHIQLQNHGKKRSPNEFRFLIREDSKEDEKIEPSFN